MSMFKVGDRVRYNCDPFSVYGVIEVHQDYIVIATYADVLAGTFYRVDPRDMSYMVCNVCGQTAQHSSICVLSPHFSIPSAVPSKIDECTCTTLLSGHHDGCFYKKP